MKKVTIFLILTYGKLISPALKNILGVKNFCRFSPSCSEYARLSIEKYGLSRGAFMFFVRFLRCQPFANI